MSLITHIIDVVYAIGADIKSLKTSVTAVENKAETSRLDIVSIMPARGSVSATTVTASGNLTGTGLKAGGSSPTITMVILPTVTIPSPVAVTYITIPTTVNMAKVLTIDVIAYLASSGRAMPPNMTSTVTAEDICYYTVGFSTATKLRLNFYAARSTALAGATVKVFITSEV